MSHREKIKGLLGLGREAWNEGKEYKFQVRSLHTFLSLSPRVQVFWGQQKPQGGVEKSRGRLVPCFPFHDSGKVRASQRRGPECSMALEQPGTQVDSNADTGDPVNGLIQGRVDLPYLKGSRTVDQEVWNSLKSRLVQNFRSLQVERVSGEKHVIELKESLVYDCIPNIQYSLLAHGSR